jgi:hypothetical protein
MKNKSILFFFALMAISSPAQYMNKISLQNLPSVEIKLVGGEEEKGKEVGGEEESQ